VSDLTSFWLPSADFPGQTWAEWEDGGHTAEEDQLPDLGLGDPDEAYDWQTEGGR
jgi:hypothetical protein